MPSICWAGKQTHFPPLAFSQPVAIAKPLFVACSGFASFTKSCLPSALKSHLFHIALTDSALIIPIVPVPSGFPTCTPILVPRCCMELEPLGGCFLDYTVTVLFHLSYFISSRITANASRAESIYIRFLVIFPSSILCTVDTQESTTLASLHHWTLVDSIDMYFHWESLSTYCPYVHATNNYQVSVQMLLLRGHASPPNLLVFGTEDYHFTYTHFMWAEFYVASWLSEWLFLLKRTP